MTVFDCFQCTCAGLNRASAHIEPIHLNLATALDRVKINKYINKIAKQTEFVPWSLVLMSMTGN